jgi:hypothetical protein
VNAARAARVQLVSAVYNALFPFDGRRVCVCCPEAADKSALFDAVLRIAMESETFEPARRARLVIATLGAEPAHLLLAGNCPEHGSEAHEAHQFLPRCSVLVEDAKCLFAVPSVRATTFEDCSAFLPLDRDLRADAAECSREAVFRDWALLTPGQLGGTVPHAIIKSRVRTLLERRASLGLALLAGMRAAGAAPRRRRRPRTWTSRTSRPDGISRCCRSKRLGSGSRRRAPSAIPISRVSACSNN